MKNNLIISALAATVLMSSGMSFAATNPEPTAPQTQQCQKDIGNPNHNKMNRPNLDELLNLSETQKQKAHEIRMNGHQKIRPVIEKIKAKKAEIKAVEMSKLPQAEKDKKIATLKEELKPLKQEARKIRTENTKEFEAILTPEQKVKFENFKKEHKNRHHHNGCPKDKK